MHAFKTPLNWGQLLNFARRSALPVKELRLSANRVADSLLAGESRINRSGPGEIFRNYRGYSQGDKLTDIDWRRSAKDSSLVIKERERQVENKHILWRNSSASMRWRSKAGLPLKSDAANILLLAYAILVQRTGDQTLLGTQTQKPLSLTPLSDGLARFQNEDILPAFFENAALASKSIHVWASDFLLAPEKLQAHLKQSGIAKGRLIAFHVLDPAELQFPYQGRILFRDPASQDEQDIAEASALAQTYRETIKDHCTRIAEIIRRQGGLYIQHSTDTDPSLALRMVKDQFSLSRFAGQSA